MKAIRVENFGGAEEMKVKDVPDLKPESGQVVVKVKAAGVNPVDVYIRSGSYAVKPTLPYTPGIDGAGTIEAIGDGVKGYKKGDRVYIGGSLSGTYAEYALCKAPQVHPLAERVSFAQGAGVNVPYATASRALFQMARCKAGEMVLVHGASGGVGVAAIQIGRAAGLCMIGTASTERGRKLVQEVGAHHVADHSKTGYMTEILNITDGKGVGVILEMLANVNLNNDLNLVRKGGRVVVIGSRGEIQIDPRRIMDKESQIMGVKLINACDYDLYTIHSALVAGLDNGTLSPVVGQELPLAKAPDAHTAVMQPGSYGKIVLIP